MKKTLVCLLAAISLIWTGAGLAADHDGKDMVVVSLPIGNDLYIAGGKVVVSRQASGDVVAAGGSVILNGAVGQDLAVAGGNIIVNAPVQDDLRAAGGDVVISSTVGGDLVVAGGSVTIPEGAVIEGDAVIGAGTVHMGGTVKGSLRVHAGTLDLNGTVGGDARLYGTDRVTIKGAIRGDTAFAAPAAAIGPGARFDGNVSYWREGGEMEFGQLQVGGRTVYDPQLKGKARLSQSLPRERHVRKGMGGLFIGTLLSGILIIAVTLLLLKGVFRRAGEALHDSYWQSTGIGILTLILLPVAAFLAMITVLGIPLGMLLLVIFAFSLLLGRIIAAMAFAAWIERRRVAEWGTGRLLLVSIGVYAAIKLVSLVPFIGWVAALLIMLAGYGALVLGIWRTRPGG